MGMRQLVIIGLCLFGLVGCENSTAPSLGVPFSVTDLEVGTGETATSSSTVLIRYTGWLYSAGATDNKGTVFDTTGAFGSQCFSLGSTIPGFGQGIAGMREGGRRLIVIPPELGYGDQANGSVPANSTLIFEVELLSIGCNF
tara:strand:+ start:3833 stop:4258 length:426 start_codon:yes stop_codon:yes gene_type:complete